MIGPVRSTNAVVLLLFEGCTLHYSVGIRFRSFWWLSHEDGRNHNVHAASAKSAVKRLGDKLEIFNADKYLGDRSYRMKK